jgi:molybdopterin converting factor small subunit
MQFAVRLFAMLREAHGGDAVTVDVPMGATAADLKAAVAAASPALADWLPRVRVAASLAFVPDTYVFAGAEDVALIPPVSGG